MECEIERLTFGVRAYCDYLKLERKLGMDRFTEKMARAAQVVPTQTKAMEQDADTLIARGEDFDKRRKRTFAAQHAVLDTGMKGMDTLDRQLALLSNGDPFEASGDSSGGQQGASQQTPAAEQASTPNAPAASPAVPAAPLPASSAAPAESGS